MTDLNVHGFRLIDRSTLVSDSDLITMVGPLRKQALEVGNSWQLRGTFYSRIGNPALLPRANEMDIVILDDPDQANALGYHDVDPHGNPYARVFAKPVLDHGGRVLTGGSIGISVASVVSHELLEALVDQYANQWMAMPDGKTFVAKELCDPVQGFSYKVDNVELSDWITPNWFIVGSPGPWDRMGICTRSFQVAKGGYEILADVSGYNNRSVANDSSPDWRRSSRDHPAARTFKRVALPAGEIPGTRQTL
jgi:hypothetical protein